MTTPSEVPVCPDCGRPWDEHEIGVPAPYCPTFTPSPQPGEAKNQTSTKMKPQPTVQLSPSPSTLQQLFINGMKRPLPDLLTFDGPSFDLGSSPNNTWRLPNVPSLGLPDWQWPRDHIPAEDNSVATLHAYHFLEHLCGDDVISLMREAERVMKPGGSVFNFCMPYYNSNCMAQCLDHKSFWCEETFRNLLDNVGYEIAGGHKWLLRVHCIVIMGMKQDNLCVVGQLVK